MILYHEMPATLQRPSHWDLMLEDGAHLVTWALDQLPTPGVEATGEMLAPHRLAYLDYEGPVTAGRGSVKCVMRGEYTGSIEESSFSIRLMVAWGEGACAAWTGSTISLVADQVSPIQWKIRGAKVRTPD